MSIARLITIVAGFASLATIAAHGTVSGIVADGVFYLGYNPSFQYQSPPPTLVAWSTPQDLDNGFVPPSSYTNSDIICHKSATNAGLAAPIKAGGKIEFQWTPWPSSHKGPITGYMANCYGPCETVDKTTLKWFKIDHTSFISGNNPGTWWTDTMIANNNSWTVTIPPTLVKGNYVIRHEIIALHAAQSAGGAQNYPFCFNLAVSGTGTANPSATGVLATSFYTPTDPGILFNLYTAFTSYTIPGPPLWSGAVNTTQTLPAAPTASASGIYTLA